MFLVKKVNSLKKIGLIMLLATTLSQNVNAGNEKYTIKDTQTPTEKRNDALALAAMFVVDIVGIFGIIGFFDYEKRKTKENIKRKLAEKQNMKKIQKQR